MISNSPVRQTVTVIIPAFNEEARIGAVLRAANATAIVNDIVVVSDGSTDRTADIASSYNVRVERLQENIGKGGAMLHGAKCAEDADIVIFLDADLVGLKPEHIESLVQPVLSGQSSMAIGQFVGGRGVTDLAQLLVKCISGQRAIRRNLFLSIPAVDKVGYGVEMLITLHVSRLRLGTEVVQLRGVTHPMKEEKLGFVRGMVARLHMYIQMARLWAVYHFNALPPDDRSNDLPEMSDKSDVEISDGSGQDYTVDSVQNTPVAR